MIVQEFGGPLGVTAIAVIFPLLMLYFWSCLEFNNGQFYFPESFTSAESWAKFGARYMGHIKAKAIPTVYSIQIYIGYVVFSALLAFIMPGPIVKGMPVPSLNYKQLLYTCNGYSSFYFTVFLSLVANQAGWFKLRDIVDNFGALLMTAIATGWIMSFAAYALALILGTGHRLSGNHIYGQNAQNIIETCNAVRSLGTFSLRSLVCVFVLFSLFRRLFALCSLQISSWVLL